MAEPDQPPVAEPKPKRRMRPLILGVVAAVVLGAGGFFATYAGLVLQGGGAEPGETPAGALPDIAFVPVTPVLVSLGPGSDAGHLRFTAQLEVANSHAGEVTMLLPRILDVLNGYLRAVSVAELEDPAALVRIRAQMLRRIQVVTGEGRVRDLLVTEFVLN